MNVCYWRYFPLLMQGQWRFFPIYPVGILHFCILMPTTLHDVLTVLHSGNLTWYGWLYSRYGPRLGLFQTTWVEGGARPRPRVKITNRVHPVNSQMLRWCGHLLGWERRKCDLYRNAVCVFEERMQSISKQTIFCSYRCRKDRISEHLEGEMLVRQ